MNKNEHCKYVIQLMDDILSNKVGERTIDAAVESLYILDLNYSNHTSVYQNIKDTYTKLLNMSEQDILKKLGITQFKTIEDLSKYIDELKEKLNGEISPSITTFSTSSRIVDLAAKTFGDNSEDILATFILKWECDEGSDLVNSILKHYRHCLKLKDFSDKEKLELLASITDLCDTSYRTGFREGYWES